VVHALIVLQKQKDNTTQLMSKKFITTFLAIAMIGTGIAIALLVAPLFGWNTDRLANSSQIASTVAAISGLAVAALALLSYVWSESYERKATDEIWDGIQEIDYAFKYAATLNNNIDAQKGDFEPEFQVFMLSHLLTKLSADLDRAMNGKLLGWLEDYSKGKEPTENLASQLVFLRMALAASEATGYSSMPTQFYSSNKVFRTFLDSFRKSEIKIK
jgi:F0F1-type ATP synthase assembly protein I